MIGQTIGNYRILAKLGGGGMGVVYSAEDTRLGRQVALKFLSEELARNPQALERFEREARAASALNHPNIATVYDVGAHEGRPYLVMELLDGRALDERLQGRTIDVATLVEWGIQTADALDAAHAKGIVHRDVKPGNLFVNARGQVKVLDFGLAKLTERAGGEAAGAGPMSAGPTVDDLLTSPGVAIGTVSYMSPEQARGEELDARSDLFSLGCVLYEMATGQRAFAGKTAAVIFHAILERTPAPANEVNPAVPLKLGEIIARALEKDREMRYQTAAELRADLKRLKRDLSAPVASAGRDLDSGRAMGSGVSSASRAVASGAPAPATTTRGALFGGGLADAATPAARWKRPWLGLALGLFATAAFAFGLLLYSFTRGPRPQSTASNVGGAAPFSSLNATRLTTSGNVVNAAISRDGHYVAYSTFDGTGRESLWNRQVGTSSAVQLLMPDAVHYMELAFSPDGMSIYYLLYREAASSALPYYEIASIGGSPRLLIPKVLVDIALSFDGRKVVYGGIAPGEAKPSLLVADLSAPGEAPRVLMRGPDLESVRSLAWSPDGKQVALLDYSPEAAMARVYIRTLDVGSGSVQPLGTARWRGSSGGFAWLPDGSGLLLTARERTGQLEQVWYVSFPRGDAQQITRDVVDHMDAMSVTGNGSSFVAIQRDLVSNLWVAPRKEEKHAQQITSGRSDGVEGLAWAPGGKLAYLSDASGTWQVWLTDDQGGRPRQLTTDAGFHVWATVCAGTNAVFYSTQVGSTNELASVSLDDGRSEQVTRGGDSFVAADCSPDGTWFAGLAFPPQKVFDDFASGKLTRLDRTSGQRRALYDGLVASPRISPDGKRVAFIYKSDPASAQYRVGVISAEGGALQKSLAPPNASRVLIPLIRWTPDGKAIAFADSAGGVSNLVALPLDGGKPKQITHFSSGLIFNFAWSNDGKLALASGSASSDAVLFSSAH
ncbi:MAG TPA: protein kinase [Candidatus Acidoferrales bacterium]|nr:protein kinase [Candidatus Acidoferrales bacterium]